jgi:hypothetical protein
MRVYLIILLIFIDSIASQLLNNESLLVFVKVDKKLGFSEGLFTKKFEKSLKQINESDSNYLFDSHDPRIGEIDYSLSANVLIKRGIRIYNNSYYDVFYAIPINKR